MSIQSYQDTLGKAGKLPQQITDATHSISEGAKKVHDMTTKIDAALKQIPTYNPVSGAVIGGLSKAAGALDNAAAKAERAAQAIDKAGNKIATTISPISKAAQSVRQSLTDLQNCKAVLNASSLVVDAAVNSVTGHFHPRANEKAFANFDTTWDSWAKMVNTTYGKLYPAGQKNILETLARANFGDNVYALGSAIKNESAGIFGGIADFEDAIHAFRGSYRNPIEAAKKIEAGVKGIINATERVANSINGMVKAYQSKGGKIKGEMPGNPILSYIGNLHNTKAISAINKTLTVGGGAATLWTDGVGIKNAVGSGDIKKIYSAGKKTVDDAKAIVKGLKNNSATPSPSASQAAQKQSSDAGSQKQDNKQQNNAQGNNLQVGGGDSYVCSGATMRCSMGTNLAKLTVLPSRTVFLTGQPMANISDHLSMVNLAPFGRCRSLGFPATASATAANHGSLTPMPCMHNTPFPWMSGKDDYIVKGDPAMLKSSTCSCMWGGTISIVNDGQTDTGLAELSRNAVEEFEKDQVKTDELSVEEILDGIQLALDAAGMVPGVGAIPDLTNAAISALRGNWLDAGMSLIAAVPGIGDVAGGAKLVKNGVKLANKVKMGAGAAETGTKVRKASSELAKGTEKGWTSLEKNLSKSDSKETLRRARAKMLEEKTGIKCEYDPKNSEILYDTVEPVGKPLGSITTSAHKVTPVNEVRPVYEEKAVAKRLERNQSDIKNGNEALKKRREKGASGNESESLKYQGGQGKDPSKKVENIDYLA